MKKTLILLLALIPLCTALFAQRGIHIGIGVMPQNTWIINKEDKSVPVDTFSYKFTLGYAGMFKVGYNFGDPFGIHLGVFYSKQGQKHEYTDSSGHKLVAQRDLRYVKFPLLMHFGGNADNPVNMSFDLGPQLDFVLDATYIDQGTPIDPGFDYKQAFRLTNVSFAWSLGVDFKLADGVYFNVTHRGDYSILDIENKALTLPGTTIPFYAANRTQANNLDLGLMAGFTFCFLPSFGTGHYY